MNKLLWTSLTTICLGLGIAGCVAAGDMPHPPEFVRPAPPPVQPAPVANRPAPPQQIASDYQHVHVLQNGASVCNSDAFAQIPGEPSLFIGRILNVNPTKCSNAAWTMALFTMDWSNHTLVANSNILSLPAVIAAGPNKTVTLKNAYDPYVARYNGELWVSFECLGDGLPHSSTCVGPLNEQTKQLDLSRTTAVVAGLQDVQVNKLFSASDPKLFVFRGSLYLYWTIVTQNPANGQVLTIAVRGMQLAQEPAGSHRLWGKGTGTQMIMSNNPQLTSAVLSPKANDPLANRVVDVFDLQKIDDSHIVITAGVGGGQNAGDAEACGTPISKNFGCYRLEVFESSVPLGNDVFSHRIVSNSTFPINGQEYSRFIRLPDGSQALMGNFFAPPKNDSSERSFIVNPGQREHVGAGLQIHRIDPRSLQFTDWN